MSNLKSLFACLVVAASSSLGLAHAASNALVETDAGPVRGIEQGELLAWRAIPYAAPPVGDLRWKAPQRPRPWTAPLDASSYGETCAQNADLGVFASAGGSEDCLTLNVAVGKQQKSSDKGRPVFVWIHGGAQKVGAARDHDPSKLAIDGGAVVVTINYRLGLFGFFAHPALKRDGQPGVNFGLMDQQFALDWVQRNIRAFGGDPDNVTIAGESAGGDSVISHIVSPGSAGKFQHAIVMSGNANIMKYPTFAAPSPLAQAAQTAQAFAKEMKCDSGDVAACLRSLSTQQVLAHQGPYAVLQVIVDGDVLPMAPGDALRAGRINAFSTFMNGTTRDEGTFFAGYLENESGQPMDEAGYAKMADAFFGPHAAEVMEQYPASGYLTPSDAFSAAATDMLFACTAHAVNGWMAKKVPTYAYEFADRTAPSYLQPTTFVLGAAHTYELSYLFPGFRGGAGVPVSLNPLQQKLSDQMVGYWTDLANAPQRHAQWPRYEAGQDNVMSLVLPQARMTQGTFAQAHQCAFWDGLGIY